MADVSHSAGDGGTSKAVLRSYFFWVAVAVVLSMGLAALLLYAPDGRWKIILFVGIAVGLALLILNPERRYIRMSAACLGVGAFGGFSFTAGFFVDAGQTGLGHLAVDHSIGVTLAGVAGACFFAWLDFRHRGRRDLPGSGAPIAPPGAGPVTNAPQSGNAPNNGGQVIQIVNPLGPVNVGGPAVTAPTPATPAPPGAKSAAPGPSTVPTPSATFVPRKNITAKIHAVLQKDTGAAVVRQAVTRAMGGYGKTVAAILYAHEYAASYPGGRFFLPVEKTDIVQAISGLTVALGLPATTNPAADAQAVKLKLQSGEPSLLILDNVESKAAWEAMLKTGSVPRGHCRVLVTTRDEAIDPAGAIKIGRLTHEEAREIYKLFCADRREGRTGSPGSGPLPEALPTPEIADAITDWLGGLAVAVSAVAAFMKLNPEISWEEHWSGDGHHLRGLKNTPVADLPDVLPEVAAQLGLEGQSLELHRRTLRVIDDAFSALPAPERRAAEYAALLPQDQAPGIWLELLLEADAARTDGPLKLTLPATGYSKLSPAQAVLNHLDKLDVLLPGGEGGKLLSLHRLWHARTNERWASSNSPSLREGAGGRAEAIPVQKPITEQASLRTAIFDCAAGRREVILGEDLPGGFEAIHNPLALTTSELRWELLPLVSWALLLVGEGNLKEAFRIAWWAPSLLRSLGHIQIARELLDGLLSSPTALMIAAGPIGVANLHSDLAATQLLQGDAAGALASIQRTIAIKEALPNLCAEELAPSYNNLAMIQQELEDFSAAKCSIERAIAFSSRHFSPDHLRWATLYANLATIECNLGEPLSARANMEQAIEIQLMHLPTDHPNFALRYSSLAAILQRVGDLSGARSNIERAIKISEKHFSWDHPSFAIRYNNLAHICSAEGDQAGACENFAKAVRVLLRHFDEDHPQVRATRAAMKAAGCGE